MNYVPGDLRDQLAHVGYDVVQAGLVCGSGGNLSARIPDEDAIWVTASGSWLDRLSRNSFTPVRISDGSPATVGTSSAPRLEPTSEIALHLALYRARPDVNAVVHLHPQTALLLDALGEHIRIVTTDHAFFLRRVFPAPFPPPGRPEGAVATGGRARGRGADRGDGRRRHRLPCAQPPWLCGDGRFGGAGPQACPQPGRGRPADVPRTGRGPAGEPAGLPRGVPRPAVRLGRGIGLRRSRSPAEKAAVSV